MYMYIYVVFLAKKLLNPACTSLWQAHIWFLKLFLCVCLYVCVFACECVCACVCVCVCVCVYLRLRLLITSGVIWIPYDWLNKFLTLLYANCSWCH